MAGATGNRGGNGFIIVPDPNDVAKELRSKVSKQAAKTVGQLHKKLGDTPVNEGKRRSDAAPRGGVRIGRSLRASATVKALTVAAGGGAYPDWAGQEWGSKRYARFQPFIGGGDDGYVMGRMMKDDAFMTRFMDEYVDGLSELLETVFDG